MWLLDGGEVRFSVCWWKPVCAAGCWAEQAAKPDKLGSCWPHNEPAGWEAGLCHRALHIQNQGRFAPLITVFPLALGRWACDGGLVKIREDFLPLPASKGRRRWRRTAGSRLLHAGLGLGLGPVALCVGQEDRGGGSGSWRAGFVPGWCCTC